MNRLTDRSQRNELILGGAAAPILKGEETTASVMLDVIVALLPALALSVWFFGWRSLALTLASVACCLLFEFLFQKLSGRPARVGDLSSVVTGALFAFTLPASAPYYTVAVGAFVAIVAVKELFGGIGRNFLNPALAARAVVGLLFPAASVYAAPGTALPVFGDPSGIGAVLTPLASLGEGKIPALSLFDLAMGRAAGPFGAASAALLCLGGLYLLLRRVITPHVPLAFLSSFALLTCLFPQGAADPARFTAYSLLSGGLVLAAFFMATDYATSPAGGLAKLVFGVGCGLLAFLFRRAGTGGECALYAVLVMNCLAGPIDRVLLALRRLHGPKSAGKREGAK